MHLPWSTPAGVIARVGHIGSAARAAPANPEASSTRGASALGGTSSAVAAVAGYVVVTIPLFQERWIQLGIVPHPSVSAKARPKLSSAKWKSVKTAPRIPSANSGQFAWLGVRTPSDRIRPSAIRTS